LRLLSHHLTYLTWSNRRHGRPEVDSEVLDFGFEQVF
ncbi:MAG: hypothetical protein QOE19_1214, partial [Actinomycetota bacterium]|nr:hypothetical protein [Actinomycetota bacterium]